MYNFIYRHRSAIDVPLMTIFLLIAEVAALSIVGRWRPDGWLLTIASIPAALAVCVAITALAVWAVNKILGVFYTWIKAIMIARAEKFFKISDEMGKSRTLVQAMVDNWFATNHATEEAHIYNGAMGGCFASNRDWYTNLIVAKKLLNERVNLCLPWSQDYTDYNRANFQNAVDEAMAELATKVSAEGQNSSERKDFWEAYNLFEFFGFRIGNVSSYIKGGTR